MHRHTQLILPTSSAEPQWRNGRAPRLQRCGADGADGVTTWQVGAACAPLVRVLMVVCSPVALPISSILDRVLGPSQKTLFQRAELTALVDLETEQVREPF